MPLSNGDTSYLNNLELDLNTTIQTEAAAAGVHYVSTYTQFEGHGSCATGSNHWINPIIASNGGISVHPNATGEQEMADILEAALAANGIS
jgi:lysophospholipase L1-like esterase